MTISETMATVTKEPALAKPSRRAAYMELTKLRISLMVLITFAAAGVISATGPINWVVFLSAIFGMLAISASGNAMNMYLERYTDFLMDRTRQRPLPAQKLSANEVALFTAVSFGVGAAILFMAVNWQTGLCGVVNWFLYVAVYTPLKTRTAWNTEVGAIAGALPVVMGCLAMSETVPLVGWAFFLLLVFWQFPHFMAIAWMYRHDYAKGGLKMLTVTDPTGRKAGRKAIVLSFATLLVSLLPVLTFGSLWHSILFSFGRRSVGLLVHPRFVPICS